MPAKKIVKDNSAYAFALARIALGLTFLWAFFDKAFGLGFATCRDKVTENVATVCSAAWVKGGSPTLGFLKFGTSGPLADFYQGLAGKDIIDWIFMIGLLGIGIGLTFGIAMKISSISATIMLLMMWSAALWPANNPFIDDHIIYALVLIGLMLGDQNQVWGLRRWWQSQSLVKKYPVLG